MDLKMIWLAALTGFFISALTGCAITAEDYHGRSYERTPDRAYEKSVALLSGQDRGHSMRHTIREMMDTDLERILKMVRREVDFKERDDEILINMAAVTLGQTIMMHPGFNEREAAFRELKMRVQPEYVNTIIARAIENLLDIAKNSPYPADQAGANLALTNLVLEMKSRNKKDFVRELTLVAEAGIKVSDDAKTYAKKSMIRIVSPSIEARAALATL
jgi:hypothetical protein